MSHRRRWARLGAGVALAAAAAWWLRPAPQLVRARLPLRPTASAPGFRVRVHSHSVAASSAVGLAADETAETAQAADDAEPGAGASRLAEDRNLGLPGRMPSGTASDPRVPVPPPPLPLDPDEITADDPHDFDLPRAESHPR